MNVKLMVIHLAQYEVNSFACYFVKKTYTIYGLLMEFQGKNHETRCFLCAAQCSLHCLYVSWFVLRLLNLLTIEIFFFSKHRT